MKPLECHQFSYLSDNYGVLVHAEDTGETACIDAGDAQAVFDALESTGWSLSHLLITHHHADHTDGLEAVKEKTGCLVIGPAPESSPIPGLDKQLGEGDSFDFAGRRVEVLHTPGHTTDMINFRFVEDALLFTGDTLFSLGCGRLFEGTAPMMWESLGKLAALPEETTVYCAHEYTQTNAQLAVEVDPDNQALAQRVESVKALRADGQPTVPTSLAEELATNPFLRVNDSAIRTALDMADAEDVEVFAELRRRRDKL